MATPAISIRCDLSYSNVPPAIGKKETTAPDQVTVPKPKLAVENGKIVLQPRLSTLRSYGSDRVGVIKTMRGAAHKTSPFFEALSDYIDSSNKSHDFEIISGRLAMIVFAASVTVETVTGNSIFSKMDVQGMEEAGGVCLAAVACAATFAWLTIARNRVGGIFTSGCNTFIDSLIDQVVDGLFYDTDLTDWSDDI